jgi:hypothetical protein
VPDVSGPEGGSMSSAEQGWTNRQRAAPSGCSDVSLAKTMIRWAAL